MIMSIHQAYRQPFTDDFSGTTWALTSSLTASHGSRALTGVLRTLKWTTPNLLSLSHKIKFPPLRTILCRWLTECTVPTLGRTYINHAGDTHWLEQTLTSLLTNGPGCLQGSVTPCGSFEEKRMTTKLVNLSKQEKNLLKITFLRIQRFSSRVNIPFTKCSLVRRLLRDSRTGPGIAKQRPSLEALNWRSPHLENEGRAFSGLPS